MGPSGNLAVAIPLYRIQHDEALGKMEGYNISLTKDEPLAYVIDAGPEAGTPQLMNAKFIEKHAEFLGDL